MASNLKKKEALAKTPAAGHSDQDGQALHDRVAKKAYELYLKRGGSHGNDLQDWLEAERLVSINLRVGPNKMKPS